jgi:thiamine pyrophosphate-dependent acetolactate synthase large subunit-like protein
VIRVDCLKVLKELAPDDTLFVVTLGVTTDELYDLGHREATMYLPAMGCNIPVGLGLATALPHRRVLVLDSDGSLLMSLGILTTVAAQAPRNLGVIVFDNQCYESIGGSPTPGAAGADLAMIARGAGIKDAVAVDDLAGFRAAAQRALTAPGPVFVNARFQPAIQKVKPKTTDIFEDKYRFARYIERSEGVEILAPAVRGRRAAQAFAAAPSKPAG